MTLRVEDVSPVEKRLVVEVPWETVSAKLSDSYKELSKGVALKGFRKGKVPRSVLERMFGKQVRAEVANQLVRESFLQAAQEHHMHPVGDPKVEDASLVDGEGFKFTASIEVRQHLDLAHDSYEGLELSRTPIAIGEEAVDRALEMVRRDQTELMPVEGREETAPTDILAIQIKGKVGEIDIDRQTTVDLEDASREPLPGIAKALTGIPLKAVEHPVTLDISAEHPNSQIAGTQATLVVSVLDARQKRIPELDDDLAKETGRAQTLAELRQVVRGDLEKRAEQEIQGQLRQAALRALVQKNPIPVAPSLVERTAQSQLKRLREMFAGQGVDEGAVLDGMMDKLRESAADDVRGQLLLEAVAEHEKLEVGEEEINAQVEAAARSRGQRPNKLRAELERDGKLESIIYRLRQDKVLDLLVSRAKISDAAPSEPSTHEGHTHESPAAGEGEPAGEGAGT